jgi:hypothetical protein
MTIDERLEAVTMNLELMSHNQEAQDKRIELLTAVTEKLVTAVERDAENIRALARIAEAHEQRLTDIEDGPQA